VVGKALAVVFQRHLEPSLTPVLELHAQQLSEEKRALRLRCVGLVLLNSGLAPALPLGLRRLAGLIDPPVQGFPVYAALRGDRFVHDPILVKAPVKRGQYCAVERLGDVAA
jgi:hypothetical protein